MAASSSSVEIQDKGKYEVFINFRGDDVRWGFLSHLRVALKDKHIKYFVDEELEKGKDITEDLIQIIEHSDLSIVIFSENYADSEYCLKELEKIHESMKQGKQTVVPVFYKVDPSDVQKLQGKYSIRSQSTWSDVLIEISNLSGFASQDQNFENEVKFIEGIVGAVSDKLSASFTIVSTDEDGLFGIGSSIKHVEKLLLLNSTNDVRMVGIWGLGGIGKTTLARKVFENIIKKFRGHAYFVDDVSKTLCTFEKQKRDEIIKDLLGDKNINIRSSAFVDNSIRRRLKQTKVLLVLDDVQTCMELDSLLKKIGLDNPESFCPGSRIIVTSRDWQVLKDLKFKSSIYEVKQLKNDKALELLSWRAFGQNKPQQGYENISEEVVRYAGGIPLVLVVLGSDLKSRDIKYWEAELQNYRASGDQGITQFFRVIYDRLSRLEKDIFLDIACIIVGFYRKDFEEHAMYSFGGHARNGIDRLIDKSLLMIRKGEIKMHDLLRQMGEEIVVGERETQGQSRLWEFEDVKDALTNGRGTKNVEAMELYYSGEGKIDVNPDAFIPMQKLRQLKWKYYPLNSLPSNYNLEKLVELELGWFHFEEINWSKPLMNLKRITLFCNKKLTRILDLAMAPNLEYIVLSDCDNLDEVGSSLENLNKLTLLMVRNCGSLSHLPELPCSITRFSLAGSVLRQLPSTIGRLTLIKNLSLKHCTILKSLPSSISSLSSLEYISLLNCSNIRQLPEGFGNLKSLKELDVSCSGLIELPEDIGNLEALEELDASYTDLRELPPSIQNLNKLMRLKLIGCKQLHYPPALPPSLESFYATSLSDEMSSSIIEQYFWDVLDQPTKVRQLCVNGSHVPDLMMHRVECGSSVSLDHETPTHSAKFLFGVVYSSNRPPIHSESLQIKAVLQFSETECSEDIFGYIEPLEDEAAHDSGEEEEEGINLASYEEEEDDDIDIDYNKEVDDSDLDYEGEESYVVLWNRNRDCKFVTQVSFQINFTDGENGKIIKCGVHPIIHSKRKHTDRDLLNAQLNNLSI